MEWDLHIDIFCHDAFSITALIPINSYSKNRVYPAEYEGHFDSLMISREEIMEVVRSLANQIKKDYKSCRPVMICILKGANPVSIEMKSKYLNFSDTFSMKLRRSNPELQTVV